MKQSIQYIRNTLKSFYPDSEVEGFIAILFQHFLGYNATQMVLKSDQKFDASFFEKIEPVLGRLKNHEPIQYILGETTFYDLRFEVDQSVLIPRGETEELVDHILKQHKNQRLKVLDIGTGSGIIPVTIKKNNSIADVFACDISNEALQTAQKNALLNQVEVHFFKHDILSDLPLPFNRFDLWVSNPPYVTEKEKAVMERNVLDYEPHLALFVPDTDPLKFYRAITLKALGYLSKGGELWFEINEAFGNEVAGFMQQNGFESIIINDINGKNRFIKGKL